MKATMSVAQYYISIVIDILLSRARHDGSDLIDCGQVIPATIIPGLQDDADAYVGLQVRRSLLHDVIGLLIQRHKRVDRIEHMLEVPNKIGLKTWIAWRAKGKGSFFNIYIELGIRRISIWSMLKDTHIVVEAPMNSK